MPEFEKTNSQPNPAHSYTPSTNGCHKKAGRRRSGGFKSETVSSVSKIGEIDLSEALKADVKENASRSDSMPSDNATDAQTCCSVENSKPSRSSCSTGNKKKSTDAQSQPSKAIFDSIKKVEERIEKRRAEIDKNRSEKSERSSKKRVSRNPQNRKKAAKGGLLATIGRFFGLLLGGSSEDSSVKDRERLSQRRRPRNNNQRRDSGQRKDDSGKRRKNNRGGQNNRRKRTSHKT